METGSAEYNVLIVEDDENLGYLLKVSLDRDNIATTLARNGAEALEAAADSRFDLMTIDHFLPDMTGDKVILSMRQEGLDIPFVMITGRGNEDLAVQAMKLGALDYLAKDDSLFQRVAEIVPEMLEGIKNREQLMKKRSALFESEKLFSAVFHLSSDGIVLLDDRLTVLDLNKRAVQLLGYNSRAGLAGKDMEEIFSPAVKAEIEDLYERSEENAESSFKTGIKNKSGNILSFDIIVNTFRFQSRLHAMLNIRDMTEHLHHLEALRNAAQEWRSTFDSINDMISVHDRGMRIVRMNKAFMEFVGKPYEEIIGRRCHEVLHPTSFPFTSCPHQKTLERGLVVTDEVDLPEIGIPLLVTTSPIFDERGEIRGSVHVAKDVSELKKAHAELQERERFLGDILDSIQDGITILDENFRIVRVNQYMKIKYQSMMPLEGKHCYDVFQDQTEPCDLCPTRRTLQSGEPSSEVICFKTSSYGQCGWMEVYTFPLEDEDGRIIGIIEYMRDITKRRAAEEQLKESEEKYRRLFDDAHDAIMVIDSRGGIIVECNRAAEELTGYGRTELIGMDQAALHPGDEREDNSATVLRHYLDSPGEVIEEKILRKDGAIRDVSIKISRVSYLGTEFMRGVYRDITERKRINERVKQAQKLESIGTLAGGIAHDFNNILTAVIGFSDIIKTDLLSDEQPRVDDVDGIIEAAHRASELVKQVLTFSRQSEMERNCLDITPIIKETVKFLKASLPSTITIKEQINIIRRRIYADPVQMHQVVMNLCTNAHHAMLHNGGTLSIILDEIALTDEYLGDGNRIPPGEYVCLTVSDTGHGMDEMTLSKIFDPFFSTKSRDQGTGLGLSVVHGIIESHDGYINVYSSLGTGTTFRVYLPIAGQDSREQGRYEREVEIPRGTERLLIVDDEMSIVRTGKRMLTRLGYEVKSFTDSVACLEEFRRNVKHYDLVITDLTMPHLTGLDLAAGVKKISPGTPVILMTGFANALEEGDLEKHNIDYLIKKPVLKKDISVAIREALDQAK